MTRKVSKLVFLFLALSVIGLIAGCSCSGTGTGTPTVAPTASGATLLRIEISPPNPTVPVGTKLQFVATGVYEDRSLGRSRETTQDVTSLVEWKSHDTGVATISNEPGSKGLATFVGRGTLNVTASLGETTSEPSVPVVTDATLTTIQVTPMNPSIPLGQEQQFTATGIYSDSSTMDLTDQVTWSSSDPAIGTVSDTAGSKGLGIGLDVGQTDVAASLGDVTSPPSTMTVTNAVLVTIQVNPATPTIANGFDQEFTATGIFSDGTTLDMTSSVEWSTSDTGIATISNTPGTYGLATSAGVGDVTVYATDPPTGVTGNTVMTVADALLVSMEVLPATGSIAKGTTQQFTVNGTFTDGSTRDITTQVTYSSDDASVNVSNGAGTEGLATGMSVGSATITVQDPVSGLEQTATLDVTAAELVSIQVDPAGDSIPNGTTQQFTATGIYTDGSNQDLTTQVTWTSSNGGVASIVATTGLATANAVGGPVTITATHAGTGIIGDTQFTITAAVLDRIEVTPVNPSIPDGFTQQFTATGVFTDGTTVDYTNSVTWSSGNTAAATVNATTGLATSVDPGTATMTALDPVTGKSGTSDLEVRAAEMASIVVEADPAPATVIDGYTKQFKATATFTDGSSQVVTDSVTWESSDPTKATISNSNHGLATGVDAGTTDISAYYVNPLTGRVDSNAVTLTVDPAIPVSLEITPDNSSLPLGGTRPLMAEVIFSDGTRADVTDRVSWTSSVPTTAAVSNASGTEGEVTTPTGSTTTGTVVITADDTATSGFSDTTNVTVTSAELQSIAVTPAGPINKALGLDQQFTATGTYTDGTTGDVTTEVEWQTSNSGIVAISNAGGSEGLATTVSTGTITISARKNTALGWVNSNDVSFTVDPKELVSIAVTPNPASTKIGVPVQFTATGTYTDGSTADITSPATWVSNNGTVIIDGNGLATPSAVSQTAFITANVGTVISPTSELTVTGVTLTSVTVTPDPASDMPKGTTQQFTATANYSDGSTVDVTNQATWASDNTGVATVNTKGLATAVDLGSADITAAWDPGSGTVTSSPVSVTVTPAELVSIAVSPENPTVPVGVDKEFTAIGTYTDSSTADITDTVVWTSSNTGVATISNAAGEQGIASAVAPGSTNITAALSGVTSHGSLLTVEEIEPTFLVVTNALGDPTPDLPIGAYLQWYATAYYSDGSSYDVTHLVTWTSGNTSAATIESGTGSNGLSLGVGTGASGVTATLEWETGSTITSPPQTVTVAADTIADVSVTPEPSPTVELTGFIQFKANGNFSNGLNYDITGSSVWSSSNESVATVDANGLVTPVGPGTTVINAEFTDDAGTVKNDLTPPTLTVLP